MSNGVVQSLPPIVSTPFHSRTTLPIVTISQIDPSQITVPLTVIQPSSPPVTPLSSHFPAKLNRCPRP